MLLHQQFADGFQFPPPFRGGLGIGHFQLLECIQDNFGNNQPGILLVIGGDDIPRRVSSAGRGQAVLISLHVMLPVFPLVNVRETDFPVLVRLINAREEAIPLFVLGQVQKTFNDAWACLDSLVGEVGTFG